MKVIKSPSAIAVFTLATILCLSPSVWAQSKGKLAAKRYVDPKGYFKIVPPHGWRIQEYPQDPRGKVAFIAPEPSTDLRVLVNAVDFSTTDELIKYCKAVETRTGLKTNIERIEFGGRQAVKRSFEVKGSKFYVIDFLIGSVDHNLQFAAPASLYQKHIQLVTQSMETYEAVARAVSEKEVSRHAVAKLLRLAQLMIDNGNYQLALDYINEGLEISPKDQELLKLKNDAEAKRVSEDRR